MKERSRGAGDAPLGRKELTMGLAMMKRLARRRGLSRYCPLEIVRDFAIENFHYSGDIMFEDMKKGMIVIIQALDFPFVGEVLRFSDAGVILKNAVKIIWDGRHHEYAAGKPPQSAEIEKTFPWYFISSDAIIGWGPYPGGKIPRAQ